MDLTNMDITISDKIARLEGTPDLFIDRAASDEHQNSWSNVPLDVNLEADAYANNDDDDHSADMTIDYDCLAWE
jgi:hypothetical protein